MYNFSQLCMLPAAVFNLIKILSVVFANANEAKSSHEFEAQFE